MTKNTSKVIIIVLAVILCLTMCCVVSVAGYIIIYKKYQYELNKDSSEETCNNESNGYVINNNDEDDEPNVADNEQDDKETILPDLYEYIKGHLGFPSEYIPPLNVCAENVLTGVPICIETTENQTEYSIEVEPASYYVYSEVLTGGGGYEGYRAYYNDFVLCGMSVECTSHNPVVVNVNIGETVNNIDPIDWYNF